MKITKYLGILGVILFIYIIVKIDLHQLISIFASLNIPMIILSIVMLIPLILLRTTRWNLIIKATGVDISLIDSIAISFKGYVLGSVTPGRIGDIIRARFLTKKTAISLGRSLLTAIIDRIFDISVIIVISLLGILAISRIFGIKILSLGISILILFIFALFLYTLINKKLIARILGPLFDLFLPSKAKETVKVNFDDFYKSLDLLKVKRLHVSASVFLSILSWLAAGVGCYFLALSLSLDIPYWYTLISLGISSVIAVLPISFSGLGTREAVFIFVLSIIDISSTEAVSFSLLVLVWTLLPVLPGIFLYFRDR